MNICILGAGAYGLCLGINALENNNNVTIWTKFEDEKNNIINNRTSPSLPNIIIDNRINISTNLKFSIRTAELIIIAIPSFNVREVLEMCKTYINNNQHICIASKGLENNSLKFMSDVVKEIINTNNISVISGPAFAIDIANKYKVGVSLASTNIETINITRKALENKYMRLYATDDFIGVQLCGSIKNVLAIASGILIGLNYPISTQSLFLTNAINDIKNLIIKLGGNKETITSLSGIGDIYLTCSSTKSRNFTLGTMIGSKQSKEKISNYIQSNNVEGLYALKSIYNLLKKEDINIFFIKELMDIIYNDKNVDNFIKFI